jgi:stalled ribosome rescue protein Dom34
MNSGDFPEAGTMYLLGRRQMSPSVFEKNIIQKIEERLKKLKDPPENLHGLKKLVRMEYKEIGGVLGVKATTVFGNMKNGWKMSVTKGVMENERRKMIKECELILKELRSIVNSDAISVKIGSIISVEPQGLFYDMEIPKFYNFIANGLIIHNSANRYARIREGLLHDFLKKVGEIATANFKQLPDLIGVIIAGPGPIKDEFAEGDFLEYTIKAKILGTVNTAYTGEYGLKEAVERSEDLIAEASVIKEKRILDRFFTELEKDSGLAVYGFFETANALKEGNIELLLISEAFDWVRTGFECPSCGYKSEKILDRKQIGEQKCPECNSRLAVREEKEITENIIKTAEEMGTKVEMISTDTQRGEQLKELGGIGGILRYRKGST